MAKIVDHSIKGVIVTTTTPFKMAGLAGVLKTLEELPKEIVSKSGGPVRQALRAATVPLFEEAKKNLQRIINDPNKGPNLSTGLMMQSLKRRLERVEKGGGERYVIDFNNRARYSPERAGQEYRRVRDIAWMLEFGTANRAPIPFMRPAFDAKAREAAQIFENEIKRRIVLIQKRLAKKNGVA